MAGKQDPRRLAILLGILGVIVVAVIAFRVFSGGDGDDAGATSTTADTAPDTTSEDTGPDGTGPDDTAPDDTAPDDTAPDDTAPDDETFDVFATKNPFEPLVSDIADGDGNGDGTTPTTSPDTTIPTTPGDTTTTLPFTGGGEEIPPSIEPVAPEPVALLDIFDENGERKTRVRVGSTVFTVGAGETFATSYRVVSIGETCGQFLFGDDPFELCEGEEVVK